MQEKNKVFIATPAYDGRCHVPYALMLIDITEKLRDNGYQSVTRIPTMGSLLVANRNRLIRSFMASGADWLVFIDSDLAFSADKLLEILINDIDVFAGVYPIRDGKTFVFRPEVHEDGKIMMDPTERYLKLQYAPAGFMVIKREVIERLQDVFPHLCYKSQEERLDEYAFFNTEVYQGEFWGEDYVFCRRLREAGFSILTDPFMDFNHAGIHGNLMSVLTDDPEKAEKVAK